MFYDIPSHLQTIHERLNRKTLNRIIFEKGEANFCYRLESLYLKPIFYKSDTMIAVAKQLSKEKHFKKHFENWVYSIFKNNDLFSEKPFYNLDLKYNSVNKSNKSYYKSTSKTIYLNGNLFNTAKKSRNIKDILVIMYIILHEISHAIIDIKFNSDGIHVHDEMFLYILIELLVSITNISKNKFLFRYNNKQTLIQYCSEDIFIYPIFNNHIKKVSGFQSIESASSYILQQYKITIPSNFKSSFDENHSYFHSEDDFALFYQYKFFFIKNHNTFDLYVFKEEEHKQNQQKEYFNLLQKIYNRKNKINN